MNGREGVIFYGYFKYMRREITAKMQGTVMSESGG